MTASGISVVVMVGSPTVPVRVITISTVSPDLMVRVPDTSTPSATSAFLRRRSMARLESFP